MGAERRLHAAREAVGRFLVDAYVQRDRVAVVTFGGGGATVTVRPTGSTEIAAARLEDVTTGGRTPLAAGIDRALHVVTAARRRATGDGPRPLIVLVSDGRATEVGATLGRSAKSETDPVAAAMVAAGRVRAAGVEAIVVDCEMEMPRLGLSRQLAEEMGGRYVQAEDITGQVLADAVRTSLTR
jgi:magnesium chelatase subunit D